MSSNEIPPALSACLPGVGHTCSACGRLIVDAVETPGEAYRCPDCDKLSPAPEDELTRAALADPGQVEAPGGRPTLWRLVTVVLFAVAALAIVFWKR